MLPSENIKRTLITSTLLMNDSPETCTPTAVYNVNFTMVTIFHCKIKTTGKGKAKKIKHYHRVSHSLTPLNPYSLGNQSFSLQNAGFQISNLPRKIGYRIKPPTEGPINHLKGTAAYKQTFSKAADQTPCQISDQSASKTGAETTIESIKTVTRLHIPFVISQSTSSIPAYPLPCSKQVSFFHNMMTFFECKIKGDQHIHTTKTNPFSQKKFINQEQLSKLKEKNLTRSKLAGYTLADPNLMDSGSMARKRSADPTFSQGSNEDTGISPTKRAKPESAPPSSYQPARPISSSVLIPPQLFILLQSVPLAAPLPPSAPLSRPSCIVFNTQRKLDKSTTDDKDAN